MVNLLIGVLTLNNKLPKCEGGQIIMIEKIEMSAFAAHEKILPSRCISEPAYAC